MVPCFVHIYVIYGGKSYGKVMIDSTRDLGLIWTRRSEFSRSYCLSQVQLMYLKQMDDLMKKSTELF